MKVRDFGDHKCAQCNGKGECSIETAARFFGANPSILDELEEAVKSLGNDWENCAIADCQADLRTLCTISVTTGYALAKGAQVVVPKAGIHSMLRMLSSIMKVQEHEES